MHDRISCSLDRYSCSKMSSLLTRRFDKDCLEEQSKKSKKKAKKGLIIIICISGLDLPFWVCAARIGNFNLDGREIRFGNKKGYARCCDKSRRMTSQEPQQVLESSRSSTSKRCRLPWHRVSRKEYHHYCFKAPLDQGILPFFSFLAQINHEHICDNQLIIGYEYEYGSCQ